MIKKLTLEEIKKLQIEMLKEFDSFCKNNDITYYLAYGTLLGAIRHKGYIPWDDDVDVIVPRPDIEKLCKLYKSDKYRIINTHNEKSYEFPFPRMIVRKTFKRTFKAETYGVFMDIYALDAIPEDDNELKRYRDRIIKAKQKRLFLIKIRRLLQRFIPLKTVPLLRYFTDKHENALKSIDYSSSSLVDAFSRNNYIFEKKWFDGVVPVEFEGLLFNAPSGWHSYLKHYFGDYMKLPPEDQRHPYHGTDSYYQIID